MTARELETVEQTQDAELVEIQFRGATYGAEPNAVREVPREKAEDLISRGLATEVQPRPAREVEGVWVESDTAGTGAFTNIETGVVTQPGEPLPVIEQDGGTPLEPLDAADGQGNEEGETGDDR